MSGTLMSGALKAGTLMSGTWKGSKLWSGACHVWPNLFTFAAFALALMSGIFTSGACTSTCNNYDVMNWKTRNELTSQRHDPLPCLSVSAFHLEVRELHIRNLTEKAKMQRIYIRILEDTWRYKYDYWDSLLFSSSEMNKWSDIKYYYVLLRFIKWYWFNTWIVGMLMDHSENLSYKYDSQSLSTKFPEFPGRVVCSSQRDAMSDDTESFGSLNPILATRSSAFSDEELSPWKRRHKWFDVEKTWCFLCGSVETCRNVMWMFEGSADVSCVSCGIEGMLICGAGGRLSCREGPDAFRHMAWHISGLLFSRPRPERTPDAMVANTRPSALRTRKFMFPDIVLTRSLHVSFTRCYKHFWMLICGWWIMFLLPIDRMIKTNS